MTTVSEETATLLIQIAFLVGAVTDGLAIIPMLSSRVGLALFGGDSSRNSSKHRYAMGIAASLMAGWTLLLLWGAANPIERRDILLLTVFPVITGIVIATVFAARNRIVVSFSCNSTLDTSRYREPFVCYILHTLDSVRILTGAFL